MFDVNKLIALGLSGPDFVVELERAWAAGDAVLPIDLRLPVDLQTNVIEAMGAHAIVDASGEQTPLDGGRSVESGDALVIATSGTTGEPKGVVHTHDSINASAERTSERLAVTQQDHWLCCLPLAHIGGLSVVMRSLLTGTKLTVHPTFDATAVTDAARSGVTLVSLVLAAMQRLDTTLFRAIVLGGAAPPAQLPANVFPTYGMTETGSGIVYGKKPLRDVELRITSAGEIEVRSPTLFRCYRDGLDPKVDGWFATGDSGEIDDGVLRVHGRISEVVNSGGEKLWPTVVETAVRSHAAVNDVRAFGEPHPEWGEQLVVEIELAQDEPPSLDEIRDHVKQTLPAFYAPQRLQVVDQIERTASGKIRRPGRGQS
jgi:O-succinylbenzoic acid--CoA ligase